MTDAESTTGHLTQVGPNPWDVAYKLDPGPVPTIEDSSMHERARVIAAVHGLADYIAAHPELPTPKTIDISGGDLVSWPAETERVRTITEWAIANGGHVFEGSHTTLGAITLLTRAEHGVTVNYVRHAHHDTRLTSPRGTITP